MSRSPTVFSACRNLFLNDSTTGKETDGEADAVKTMHEIVIGSELIKDWTVRILNDFLDQPFAPVWIIVNLDQMINNEMIKYNYTIPFLYNSIRHSLLPDPFQLDKILSSILL